MEDTIAVGDKETEDLAELFSLGVDILDQLGSSSFPEHAKVRGQILTLSHILARMIGRDIESSDSKKDSEKESEKETEEESKKTVGLVVEGAMRDLADTHVKDRRIDLGDVYKGELENILNRAGHDVTATNVNELASALKAKGFRVRETEYGKPPKTIERRDGMPTQQATMGDVITALAEKNAVQKKELGVLKDSVPGKQHEALKKICTKLVERTKAAEADVEKNKRRYEAAVKLIHGLVERVKSRDLAVAVEEVVRKDPSLSSFRGILVECSTREELEKKVKVILEASSSSSKYRGDLPPITDDSMRMLEESKRLSSGSERSHPLIAGIAARESK